MLRAAVRAAGGINAWSRGADISAVYVGDVLRGTKGPGEKILRALGLERRVVRAETGTDEA